MMKNGIMALLITISFLLIARRSNARFLMKNNVFIAPDNLSVFDPKLNSVVDNDSSLRSAGGHMEKDAVERVQEILSPRSGSSANSANNKKLLSFRLISSVRNTDKMESSASNKAGGVNSMVTEQRLSTSSSSPGVGHMQIMRHNLQTRNVNIIKSHHNNGDYHLKKSNKRKLGKLQAREAAIDGF
jgi:hypothetical protein